MSEPRVILAVLNKELSKYIQYALINRYMKKIHMEIVTQKNYWKELLENVKVDVFIVDKQMYYDVEVIKKMADLNKDFQLMIINEGKLTITDDYERTELFVYNSMSELKDIILNKLKINTESVEVEDLKSGLVGI